MFSEVHFRTSYFV